MKQQSIDDILLSSLAKEATDLHLSAGAPPMLRMNGGLKPISNAVLTQNDTLAFVNQLANEKTLERIAAKGNMDFSYSIPGKGRFRVGVFLQRGTYSISVRLCAQTLPGDDSLSLPPCVKDLAELKSGLVVMSGPAGSGKSTTAAWLVNRIATTRPAHIITVEEPIEILFRHGMGLVDQKEVGLDAPDRLTAVAASLREDPDVLYISSANDGATLAAAVEAAMGGILVICVLDTPGAASTVQYIVDMAGDADKARAQAKLAEALAAVVSQRMALSSGKRVPLFEVLLNSDAVKGILRENKLYQLNRIIENSVPAGMQTFDLCLARNAASKRMSPEDAEREASDRDKFRQYLIEQSK